MCNCCYSVWLDLRTNTLNCMLCKSKNVRKWCFCKNHEKQRLGYLGINCVELGNSFSSKCNL